jgi:hypothetical protein
MPILGLFVLKDFGLIRTHKDRFGQKFTVSVRIPDGTYLPTVVVHITNRTWKYDTSDAILYVANLIILALVTLLHDLRCLRSCSFHLHQHF